MTARTRTDALLIAGFCSFLFLYGLGQFGLVGADEPRYAQVAREMFDRHDWVTPTLGGEPWLEKPPLYYWQAMLAYSVFGVSDWSARIPSALDATLLVLAVYLFLRRFRPGIELDGALITASCAGVIAYARAASVDMALAATFTVAMLAWWAWRENQGKVYLAACYAFLALGALAKGPVAPFLAGLTIVLFAAAAREWRLVWDTIWLPGILLFVTLAVPWYLAVQLRNPEFFRVFILEHNLARFSSDLYHHREPFWYYLPVTLVALVPWIVLVIMALVAAVRAWWAERNVVEPETDLEFQFMLFTACWLIVPVIFFSLSQSKLPGYILPALPAGALLFTAYLQQRLAQAEDAPVTKPLAALHAVIATGWIVPALLAAYVVEQHRLPGGRPMFIALAVAFVLCAGVALTLISRRGWRMLRFVTLIPVVFCTAAPLKFASGALDQTLSARPIAAEIASIETHQLPLAVYGVPREMEYGLTFYRNRLTVRYEWGRVPAEEHLLVAPENWQTQIAEKTAGRRVSFLGHYAPQHVDYFWVAGAGAGMKH